ncbi:MAG: hypothetical protein IIZ59_02430, partial [Clostridia bacterium]|nr:hypothetical protein [Clostridia bacterium]
NSGSRRYDPYRGLAQAALTYGACANAYFDSDSSNVTEQMRSSLETADIDPPAGADYDAVVQMNEVEGVIYMGSSLLLKSSTSIRHYFGIEQGRSVDDFVFMVDGETVYPTFSKTQVTGGITYDVYFVDITDISADALITKHTFELSDAVNSDMIDISVCGYAYQKVISMGETSDDYKNLLTSLILYAKEAWQFA